MSIYGTTVTFDAHEHADDCAKWTPIIDQIGTRLDNDGGQFVLSHDVACSCAAGPIRYLGSHVLPSNTDERGGSFAVGELAGFITRDGRDDGPEEDDDAWPWLRVTIREAGAEDCQDVVLDRAQVTELRDYLSSWLDRTGDQA